jgi:hypothetical protein
MVQRKQHIPSLKLEQLHTSAKALAAAAASMASNMHQQR